MTRAQFDLLLTRCAKVLEDSRGRCDRTITCVPCNASRHLKDLVGQHTEEFVAAALRGRDAERDAVKHRRAVRRKARICTPI